MTKKQALHVILPSAGLHALVAGLLANTAVGDTPLLSAMTILMIMHIAKRCGHRIGWQDAFVVALKAFGRVVGVFILGKLLFWLPGIGNVANAVEAFIVTQAVGWSAFCFYANFLPMEEAAPKKLPTPHGRRQA